MRAYAEKFGEDPERWGMVGMLHDLDYERYPDLHTGHPRYALAELERLEFPEDMVRAVASHADYLEVSRDTPMEKTLFAVDELSGFVMACAYVRPQGIDGHDAQVGQEEDEDAGVRRARSTARRCARAPSCSGSTSTSTSRSSSPRWSRTPRSSASPARPQLGCLPADAEDHRPRGRRDRPGAARAVRPGARPRAARARARAGPLRPVAREAARDRQRDRPRGRARDARGRASG